MRIKLDENLPHGLAAELSAFGHDVDTVPQEGLRGQADAAIWSAAQLSERFLITQDLDCLDIRQFKLGTLHGLLLITSRLSAAASRASGRLEAHVRRFFC